MGLTGKCSDRMGVLRNEIKREDIERVLSVCMSVPKSKRNGVWSAG